MSFLVDRRILGLSPLAWAALGIYCGVLVAVIPRHEPWADEAQAWLIARDLNFRGILHEAGYEGTPALWYFLLQLLQLLHVPYLGMRWFSGGLAAAGVFVLLRWSPFPLALRLVLPFTFWIQYQYAVVSRNYVLFVPLVFAVSALYAARWKHFVPFCLAVGVLAQVSLHALLFSGALAATLAWELWRQRTERVLKPKDLITGWGVLLAALAFGLYCARPPTDATSTALSGNKFAHFSPAVRLGVYFLRGFRPFSFSFSHWSALAGVALLALVALLFFHRRLLLLLPFLSVWTLEGFHWQSWHAGLLFVAFIVTAWMALAEQPSAENSLQLRARNGLLVLLFLAACLQLPWSWQAVRGDIRQVYCPSQQAAEFLRGQTGKRIYGFRYQSVAILPYFDRNIFTNQPASHAFWHNGARNPEDDIKRIDSAPPDIAVIGWSRDWEVRDEDVPLSDVEVALQSHGYSVTKKLCGSMFMRDEVALRPCFVFYGRKPAL